MVLFSEPGPDNTDDVIQIACDYSDKYEYIVVASISGVSALKLSDKINISKIICVTCPQGMYFDVDKMNSGPFNDISGLKKMRDEWKKQGQARIPMAIDNDTRRELQNRNIPVVQATIPFFGPSFSLRLHLNHVNSLDIIAKTLELFSTGTLVCLETVLMAVDSGNLPENKEVLALAGTEKGLDTACILRSCASANLFHPAKGARFIEFLAKPRISYQPDINIEYLK